MPLIRVVTVDQFKASRPTIKIVNCVVNELIMQPTWDVMRVLASIRLPSTTSLLHTSIFTIHAVRRLQMSVTVSRPHTATGSI